MDDESLYRQAVTFAEAGEFNKAAPLYKRLVAKSTDPRYFVGYGVCLQRLGHWEESVAQLEHGVELKPHYCEPDARLFLAESYLRSKQKSKAIQQWRIVASMSPEYPSYEATAYEARAQLEAHAKRAVRAPGA